MDPISELIMGIRKHPYGSNISDMDICADDIPWICKDGDYIRINELPEFADVTKSTSDMFRTFCEAHSLNSPLERLNSNEHMAFDASVQHKDLGIVRVHAHRALNGKTLNIRLLHNEIPKFEDLGLPKTILELPSMREGGLILFTGPTGMGKSTALASLIQRINELFKWKIVTLEDPIEYRFTNRKSKIDQMELGMHFTSFASALEGIVRTNLSAALIGEMRDMRTMKAAIELAQTGHLVFATQHDRGATSSASRIINSFSGEDANLIKNAFIDVLIAIVSLRLVRRANGDGRVAACEIMVVNTAVKNHMLKGEFDQIYSVMEGHHKQGMHTLEKDLLRLVEGHVINLEDAQGSANKKDLIKTDIVSAA